MPLDPQVQNFLQIIKQLELPPLSSLDPVKAREQAAKLRGKPLRRAGSPRIENRTIPGPNGDISIRIYTPEGNAPFPVLVFFHGGGWVLGDLDTMDNACCTLTNNVGCVTVSVDYRLAPEHKFPAAVEDAYAATLWVAKNIDRINGDITRIAVAGDSAGGNLATVVTLIAREKREPALIYQVLIYPATHYNFNGESYREFDRGYGLTTEEMYWFWHQYLGDPADAKHPYASPLLAEDLSNLPPAFIITAECDILRDEAEVYAERLRSAGVPVQLKRYDGMIHSFVGMAQLIDVGKSAIADITAQLRLVFHHSL